MSVDQRHTIRTLAWITTFLVLVNLVVIWTRGDQVDPVSWQPPVALEVSSDDALARVELWPTPAGTHAPEGIAIDEQGRVYAGVAEGAIYRWPAGGGRPELIAQVGGRPLGMDLAPDGRLIVADAELGLLAITPSDGRVEVLVTEVEGKPLNFTDDVDVDAYGVAWFSDASSRHGFASWKDDIIENRPSGRLCSYDLNTGTAREHLNDLHFANGVAVAPDGSFVLVVETARYRIRRMWLTGARRGQDDIFLDGLPGFPDGISAGKPAFWLAIAAPRDPIVDSLAGVPVLRRMIAGLPGFLQPAPKRLPWVMALGRGGEVLSSLQDPSGRYGVITNVERHGDKLYMGSLHEPALAVVDAP